MSSHHRRYKFDALIDQFSKQIAYLWRFLFDFVEQRKLTRRRSSALCTFICVVAATSKQNITWCNFRSPFMGCFLKFFSARRYWMRFELRCWQIRKYERSLNHIGTSRVSYVVAHGIGTFTHQHSWSRLLEWFEFLMIFLHLFILPMPSDCHIDANNEFIRIISIYKLVSSRYLRSIPREKSSKLHDNHTST